MNNEDLGPELFGGDGSKIADPVIFLERRIEGKSMSISFSFVAKTWRSSKSFC